MQMMRRRELLPRRHRRPTSAFTPDGLSGLKLWLRADSGVFQDSAGTNPAVNTGDVVGLWRDGSGAGNDASQTSTAGKPRLELSVQNGRPALRFQTSRWMDTPLADLLHDFTVFVVFLDDGVAGIYERLLDKSFATGFWLGRSSSNANSWGGGVEETSGGYGLYTTFTDGAAHLMLSMRQGSTHLLSADNASAVSSTVTTAATDATALRVGNSVGSSVYLGGWLMEILLYDRALTTDERTAVKQWLNTRWALY